MDAVVRHICLKRFFRSSRMSSMKCEYLTCCVCKCLSKLPSVKKMCIAFRLFFHTGFSILSWTLKKPLVTRCTRTERKRLPVCNSWLSRMCFIALTVIITITVWLKTLSEKTPPYLRVHSKNLQTWGWVHCDRYRNSLKIWKAGKEVQRIP